MIKYIFCISIIIFNFSYSQISDFKNLNFKKADSIARELKGEQLYDLSNLSFKLTQSLDNDIEKFRAIYIWVCTNIVNDNSVYEKNAKYRNKYKNDSIKLFEWNKKISKETFQNLLRHKKTVCSGYAYLIKELSNLANIKCEIINGFGKTSSTNLTLKSLPNHSWNAVELNSKWYICDATWASGYYDPNINSFIFDYNDGYFLTNPSEFILTHLPLNKKWTLLSSDLSLEDFINFPLVYPEAFKNKIFPVSPKKSHLYTVCDSEISFQFSNNKQIDKSKLSIEIVTKNYKTNHYPNIKFNSNNFNFLYTFKEKGNYDLHIKYDDKYLITYVIDVKK